jgi:signal transduction histidine kinase
MEKANEQTLRERLNQAEAALERSERLAVANSHAGAIMHEVNNPLEAITNLVYLTKLHKDRPDQVLGNMLVIEEQLKTLGRATSQALTFHREHAEAKKFDLVDIAESALRLHAANSQDIESVLIGSFEGRRRRPSLGVRYCKCCRT